MNREIKFRAWNKKEKYIELVDDLQMFNNQLYIGIPGEDYFLGKDDVELMQYTGLHDKNGKEIYEGDIVQGLFADQEELEIKGQVIYSNGQASYIVIASNNDEWELGYLDNLEVIGNIYDNPELLGGE